MGSRLMVTRLMCGAVVALIAGMGLSTRALAASPGPAWEISSVAQPANFSVQDNPKCAEHRICDEYVVTLTNVGSRPVEGGPPNAPVVVTDTLPGGLRPVKLSGDNLESTGEGFGCPTTTTCTYEGSVRPGGTLVFYLEVEVEEPPRVGVVTNAVTVTGGGAARVSSSEPLTMPNTMEGPPSAFGFAALGFAAHDVSGGLDAQAGDHPYGVTTTVSVKTFVRPQPNGRTYRFASAEPPKDLAVYLPLGFVGDPAAAAQCTQVQLRGNGKLTETECPSASRVGTLVVHEEGAVFGSVTPEGGAVTYVYNMVPEQGYPAEFGFKVLGKPVSIYANVVHTAFGYALRVGTPGIPTTLAIEGLALTFFGDPRTEDGEPNSSQAFFANPSDCGAGPLTARVEADSWTHPGQWTSAEWTAYPGIVGCDLLQFEPKIELHPEVTEAEEPSGYEIDIKVPQTPNQFPFLATPDLRNVTMTLPEGMTISPGAGAGLVGCEATGPEGIDMPTSLPGGGQRTPSEAGEGEAIGADGMSHLVAGHCPAASQIGTVRISTPLLEKPLEGHLYVAQPQCGGTGQSPCATVDATNGRLYSLYLEAAGSGVVVKLAGSVSADPATGQLTARFTENPQLPFSEVSLNIDGGPQAPLANPRQCGAASANADLTPWSAPVTPDATLSSPAFMVGWDGNGGACPALLPFAPTLGAGSTSATAGHFTPFTLTLTREDRQQDISRLEVETPLGLLGMLSQVPLCPEPQAAQGTCSAASEIGTATVAVGSGLQPLWVSGRVYLTGPYGGGPFGLTVVVPAVAGPFNLGNVVVRSAISIDPHTAAVTITTSALPQILDGIPLRIHKLNVSVNRPGFLFNPTNCGAEQVAATVESEQGTTANLTTPFAVEGCKDLPFKPKFTVSTRGNTPSTLGKGSFGGNGASLDVKVSSKSGPNQKPGEEEANIGKVDVTLPRALSSRLTTLQKSCTAHQFATNPAGCPTDSDVGTVIAHTPVLPVPLEGPAYLVGHGGAAFPDLVTVLQGDGVVIDLTGNTQIKQGITYSKFETVPDAPIENFELKLPEGPFSVLSAVKNLCQTNLEMPTEITGQNGAVLKQSTRIKVEGCPNALSISHTTKGREFTLTIAVPGAGKLTAGGRGLSKASKRSNGRETLTLKLKARKAGKLATTVTVSFAPSEGKKLSKSLPVKFKA